MLENFGNLGNEKEKIKKLIDQFCVEVGGFPSEDDRDSLSVIFADFLTGFNMMADKAPVVTVFGSSRIAPEQADYKTGEELGAGLARLGFSVLTGGGPGLMEAVNKGASVANGRSMGINIEIPDEQRQNTYTSPSITINHFFVRKVLLVKYSTAFIFLPGGFGTLDEFFETVTLIQTGKIPPFPVILIKNSYWRGLMEWVDENLIKNDLISTGDTNYLYFCDTVQEAVDVIKSCVSSGRISLVRKK